MQSGQTCNEIVLFGNLGCVGNPKLQAAALNSSYLNPISSIITYFESYNICFQFNRVIFKFKGDSVDVLLESLASRIVILVYSKFGDPCGSMETDDAYENQITSVRHNCN